MNSLEDDYGLFKCYVVLCTRASTRGVVLELVLDTSLKYFMYSFKKFIARSCRGELLRQFLLLKKLKDLLQTEALAGNLALTNAPQYGDFWQRFVSIVKRCLTLKDPFISESCIEIRDWTVKG